MSRPSKLSIAEVEDIRSRWSRKCPCCGKRETLSSIGLMFGVSKVTIHNIVSGKTWS